MIISQKSHAGIHGLLLILLIDCTNTEEVCGNANLNRSYGTGLGNPFWHSISQDFEQCAKLCIRQKRCRSITYDSERHFCGMNSGTKSDTSTKTVTRANLEYSEFGWWPASLDKHCSSRPCDEFETCVPGTLTGETCSYSCIPFKICRGEPDQIAGATVHGSGTVRQYVCDADADLYPMPGTGNGSITCDQASSKWKPTDFRCGGLRLKPSHPNLSNIPNSGYLELFANGMWGAVTHDDWNWRATKVACKKLGFHFGGTFHKDWFDKINPNRLTKAYKLDNIGCTGGEHSLEQCPHFDCENGDIDKEVALTCFDYDIFGPGIIRLDPGPDNGVIIVKLGDAPEVGVCGNGWDDKATDVVCRSINSTWERIDKQKVDANTPKSFKTYDIDCNGDETHLFYCANKGWGSFNNTNEKTICKQEINVKCGI